MKFIKYFKQNNNLLSNKTMELTDKLLSLHSDIRDKVFLEATLPRIFYLYKNDDRFTKYIQDPEFWYKRAVEKYGLTKDKFNDRMPDEEMNETDPSGIGRYLSLLTNRKSETAKEELSSLAKAIEDNLIEKSKDKNITMYMAIPTSAETYNIFKKLGIKNYDINKTLFKVKNEPDALLVLKNFVQKDSNVNLIEKYLFNYIKELNSEDMAEAYEELSRSNDIVDFIATDILTSFEEGGRLFHIQLYTKIVE